MAEHTPKQIETAKRFLNGVLAHDRVAVAAAIKEAKDNPNGWPDNPTADDRANAYYDSEWLKHNKLLSSGAMA